VAHPGPPPEKGDSSDGGTNGERRPKRARLAKRRTDWAQERTLLAKERTFAAWLRTGLASVAVGFGVAELLGTMQPAWLAKAIGTALVVTGAALIGLGFFNYRRTFRKLQAEGVRDISMWPIAALTLVLVLAAAAGVVLILG
jgi:putative membrane protein